MTACRTDSRLAEVVASSCSSLAWGWNDPALNKATKTGIAQGNALFHELHKGSPMPLTTDFGGKLDVSWGYVACHGALDAARRESYRHGD